jgi:hypothetical protein
MLAVSLRSPGRNGERIQHKGTTEARRGKTEAARSVAETERCQVFFGLIRVIIYLTHPSLILASLTARKNQLKSSMVALTILEMALTVVLAAIFARLMFQPALVHWINTMLAVLIPLAGILLALIIVLRIRERREANLHDILKQRRKLLEQLAMMLSKKDVVSFSTVFSILGYGKGWYDSAQLEIEQLATNLAQLQTANTKVHQDFDDAGRIAWRLGLSDIVAVLERVCQTVGSNQADWNIDRKAARNVTKRLRKRYYEFRKAVTAYGKSWGTRQLPKTTSLKEMLRLERVK